MRCALHLKNIGVGPPSMLAYMLALSETASQVMDAMAYVCTYTTFTLACTCILSRLVDAVWSLYLASLLSIHNVTNHSPFPYLVFIFSS
ncbi:unnamed protein product [Periconia digitata]|uniref:Uncharacterized protein n=1 Tax=Periconia digitata TaxID=1303443 RepID=A0A9W4XIY4_9PLEO|nr:unnamed protein product [Periconia digitata]